MDCEDSEVEPAGTEDDDNEESTAAAIGIYPVEWNSRLEADCFLVDQIRPRPTLPSPLGPATSSPRSALCGVPGPSGAALEESNVSSLEADIEKWPDDNLRVFLLPKPHECIICGSLFYDALELATHWRQHSSRKRYVCKYCGKGFSTQHKLQVHKQMQRQMIACFSKIFKDLFSLEQEN